MTPSRENCMACCGTADLVYVGSNQAKCKTCGAVYSVMVLRPGEEWRSDEEAQALIDAIHGDEAP